MTKRPSAASAGGVERSSLRACAFQNGGERPKNEKMEK